MGLNGHPRTAKFGVRVWVLSLYMKIDKEMPHRIVAEPIWLLSFYEQIIVFSLYISMHTSCAM